MQMLKPLFLFKFLFILPTTLHSQWVQTPSSPPGQINDIVLAGSDFYLANGNNGIYRSTDGMLSWQIINNGLNSNQAKSVDQILVYGGVLYIATVDGIYQSIDEGNNWTKKSNGITIGPGALSEFTVSIFENNNDLFTGAWNAIYRSTDGAENWIVTNVTGEGILAKNFINHNGILFAARESINLPYGYKSTDNGITWNHLTSISIPVITFRSEFDKLWAGTIDGVWLSTDNGISWEHRSNGLSPDPYSSSIIRINGSLITSLKFGGSGMFRSSDEGLNWEDFGDGLPFLNSIEKLIVFNDKIIAATSDGLWQRDTSEVVTSVRTPKNTSPNSYELYQNYPNPFNPGTKIRYTIPSVGTSLMKFVQLKVYDVLGNEVAILVNEEKPAGTYDVEFDASGLASGIYLYRLQAGSFVETKKMVLLR